jgi:hypothetical protein
MPIFQTYDRTLALRCKRARNDEALITVNYETPGGWNRVTGMVRLVRTLKERPFKPFWEITIEDRELEGAGVQSRSGRRGR